MDIETQLAYWAEAHEVSVEDAQFLTGYSSASVEKVKLVSGLLGGGISKWQPVNH